jgi:hypothetical protein
MANKANKVETATPIHKDDECQYYRTSNGYVFGVFFEDIEDFWGYPEM